MQPHDINKIAILGESAIGKTSIAYRLVNDVFNPNHGSTIGAAFNHFRYKDIKIDMWDTAGQERYLALAPIYYRKSKIILLVFDISNRSTIDRLKYYLDLIRYDIHNDFQCIIIGNKSDLVSEDELQEAKLEIEQKYLEYNTYFPRPIKHTYLSAKDNTNIADLKDMIYLSCKEITRTENPVIKLDYSLEYAESDSLKSSFTSRCCS